MSFSTRTPPFSAFTCRISGVRFLHIRAFIAEESYNRPPPPGNNIFSKSLMRWLAGIVAGSGFWIAYCSSFSSFHFNSFKNSSCFAECQTSVEQIPSISTSQGSILQKTSKFIFGDAYRKKIFFNYEKRIRMHSPPEKVFEYFASSIGKDGEKLMTPADLMRAVIPVFPPSESNLVRYGYLNGERSPGELRCNPSEFFKYFDLNNDGLISFKEYIFFVTLLSFPELNFSVTFKMFDINNDGVIDREEFKKVMALMRDFNRQGSGHRDGLRFGLKAGGSVENGGLVELFFGKDGNEPLKHEKFARFLRDLHEEMLKLEFKHYDYMSRDYISGKDFALSVVASADLKDLNKLLDRVDKLDCCGDIRITFDEFKKFSELRKNVQPFSIALFCYGKANGLLTRTDFQRAASQVCGVTLSENVTKIIFHVFDTNGDGNLSADEFIRVLEKRERDIAHPREATTGVLNFLSCCWNCSNCSGFSRFLS